MRFAVPPNICRVASSHTSGTRPRRGEARMPRPVGNSNSQLSTLNQCVRMLARLCFLISLLKSFLRRERGMYSWDIIASVETQHAASLLFEILLAVHQLLGEEDGLAEEREADTGHHRRDGHLAPEGF